MSPTAVVIFAGVGAVSLAAYRYPVTWSEVVCVPNELAASTKPVNALRAMGLTPTSPMITEGATVLTKLLARMAKSAAVPRSTVPGPLAQFTYRMRRLASVEWARRAATTRQTASVC